VDLARGPLRHGSFGDYKTPGQIAVSRTRDDRCRDGCRGRCDCGLRPAGGDPRVQAGGGHVRVVQPASRELRAGAPPSRRWRSRDEGLSPFRARGPARGGDRERDAVAASDHCRSHAVRRAPRQQERMARGRPDVRQRAPTFAALRVVRPGAPRGLERGRRHGLRPQPGSRAESGDHHACHPRDLVRKPRVQVWTAARRPVRRGERLEGA
jgi:hypothetical protein